MGSQPISPDEEGDVSLQLVFLVGAIVVFLLVAFGADIGDLTEVRLTAVGLALLAAGLLPI